MTETCAECGKPIMMDQASYYRLDPSGCIGKTYHSECGDPIGVKAKDAEIAKLKQRISDLAPFLAIWADQYQRDYELDGLHPIHYDLLAETGVRMAGFRRATNAPVSDDERR